MYKGCGSMNHSLVFLDTQKLEFNLKADMKNNMFWHKNGQEAKLFIAQ